jgi:hypothetical protein
MPDQRDDVAEDRPDPGPEPAGANPAVHSVLFPGEQVLWSGRPRRHPLHVEE